MPQPFEDTADKGAATAARFAERAPQISFSDGDAKARLKRLQAACVSNAVAEAGRPMERDAVWEQLRLLDNCPSPSSLPKGKSEKRQTALCAMGHKKKKNVF